MASSNSLKWKELQIFIFFCSSSVLLGGGWKHRWAKQAHNAGSVYEVNNQNKDCYQNATSNHLNFRFLHNNPARARARGKAVCRKVSEIYFRQRCAHCYYIWNFFSSSFVCVRARLYILFTILFISL